MSAAAGTIAGDPMISEEMIGKRIRQLRIERDMTQEVMAKRSGLTKGYLSKIENSPNSPPVSTLIKISKALGVGIDSIFSEEGAETDFTVVRKSERQEVAGRASSFGYSYEPLALNYPNRHMDPYIMRVPAGTGKTKVFSHKGEEMLFALEGSQRIFIGDHTVEIQPGDCLYFNSAIPHNGEAISGEELVYLVVFYSPDGPEPGADDGEGG
jgi:transcriptional regulator with XRE-family HTH domain